MYEITVCMCGISILNIEPYSIHRLVFFSFCINELFNLYFSFFLMKFLFSNYFIFLFANIFYAVHLALEFTSSSKLQEFRQRLQAMDDPEEILFMEGNEPGPYTDEFAFFQHILELVRKSKIL